MIAWALQSSHMYTSPGRRPSLLKCTMHKGKYGIRLVPPLSATDSLRVSIDPLLRSIALAIVSRTSNHRWPIFHFRPRLEFILTCKENLP